MNTASKPFNMRDFTYNKSIDMPLRGQVNSNRDTGSSKNGPSNCVSKTEMGFYGGVDIDEAQIDHQLQINMNQSMN